MKQKINDPPPLLGSNKNKANLKINIVFLIIHGKREDIWCQDTSGVYKGIEPNSFFSFQDEETDAKEVALGPFAEFCYYIYLDDKKQKHEPSNQIIFQ